MVTKKKGTSAKAFWLKRINFMKYFSFIILVFLLGLKTASAAAVQPELKNIIVQIQKTYDETKNFTAQFKQKYTQKVLKRSEESEGFLYFQKPGQLRWDYKIPTVKSFIVNKETLWLHQPDDNIVYVNKCFKQDALTASIAFLWGQGKINEQFDTAWLNEKVASKNEYYIVLTPKQKNSIFKKIILTVDKNKFFVKESIVMDLTGNLNQFIFSDLKFNQIIAKNIFNFKAIKKIQTLPIPGSCSK